MANSPYLALSAYVTTLEKEIAGMWTSNHVRWLCAISALVGFALGWFV